MKIQCACGAKYVLDITPGTKIQFVCSACGRDYSNYLNELVRSQQAAAAPSAGAPTAPIAPATPPAPPSPPPAPLHPGMVPPPLPPAAAAPPVAPAPVAPIAAPATPPTPPPPPAPPAAPRFRIPAKPTATAPADAPVPAAAAPNPPVPPAGALKVTRTGAPTAAGAAPTVSVSKTCPRHREPATAECFVCHKPICPKCMEMFGYFCSVFCKGKAEAQHMDVPVYQGQTFVAERKYWRKIGLVSGAIAAVVLAFLGLWFWYAWFGSVPHPYFAVRFDQPSYSGISRLVGQDQIVFLHGGELARYDMKTGKEVWADQLISQDMVDAELKREQAEQAEEYRRYGQRFGDPADPKEIRRDFEASLSLHGAGENLWVLQPDSRLVRYDYATGKPVKDIALTNKAGAYMDFEEHPDEFLLIQSTAVGAQYVTHVNIATGETRTEEFHQLGGVTYAQNGAAPAPRSARTRGGGGLPLSGTADSQQALDPKKVQQDVQNLTPAARAALPALIAAGQHNAAIDAELRFEDGISNRPPAVKKDRTLEDFELIPTGDGYVQFSTRLIQEKLVERTAMKAAPKKSTLDKADSVNMANEMQIVNEQLNDIQRTAGGDTVTEDESVYRATVRNPEAPNNDWTGEMSGGQPHLYPQKTVNVVCGGKTVVVLDKSNKKLWQAELTYKVPRGEGDVFNKSPYGDGPIVEHGDTLYVADEAVLTAFDLATGNVRWRLPSVGIVGLFFDDAGDIYVNTTTGSPDDLKYSRQIDVTKKVDDILIKINPKTGKTLWSSNTGGAVSYLHGKYIYTIQSYDRSDEGEGIDTGIRLGSYLRIARINPRNGKIMWEHFQNRAPLFVQFDDNTIQLVFKKEVEVLKYLSF